jgi:catechol 2,3-dioxygenase-like lactoylglutathione lyase family enzyme
MKRFHVHVAVDDLAVSKRFYAAMFGMPPSVEKDDYAKWMLDDPQLNFAISSRGNAAGVNHLGFQAEDAAELDAIHQRLQNADGAVVAEAGASCCYAKSDKYWITDPSGIAWESFHTLDSIPTFSGSAESMVTAPSSASASACCAPPVAVAVPFKVTKANANKGACCG